MVSYEDFARKPDILNQEFYTYFSWSGTEILTPRPNAWHVGSCSARLYRLTKLDWWSIFNIRDVAVLTNVIHAAAPTKSSPQHEIGSILVLKGLFYQLHFSNNTQPPSLSMFCSSASGLMAVCLVMFDQGQLDIESPHLQPATLFP